MHLSYDPLKRAIEIQLGGVFSKRPRNPEDLLIRAIDLKYQRRNLLEEKVLYLASQDYSQAEIGYLLGYSQQRIGQILKKILKRE